MIWLDYLAAASAASGISQNRSADPLLIMESSAVPYRIQLKIAEATAGDDDRLPVTSDDVRVQALKAPLRPEKKMGLVRFNGGISLKVGFFVKVWPIGKKKVMSNKKIYTVYILYNICMGDILFSDKPMLCETRETCTSCINKLIAWCSFCKGLPLGLLYHHPQRSLKPL